MFASNIVNIHSGNTVTLGNAVDPPDFHSLSPTYTYEEYNVTKIRVYLLCRRRFMKETTSFESRLM